MEPAWVLKHVLNAAAMYKVFPQSLAGSHVLFFLAAKSHPGGHSVQDLVPLFGFPWTDCPFPVPLYLDFSVFKCLLCPPICITDFTRVV